MCSQHKLWISQKLRYDLSTTNDSRSMFTANNTFVRTPAEDETQSESTVENTDWRFTASAILMTWNWYVVETRELSQRAKLCVYQSINIPTLTCGNKFWVMTERTTT